MYSLFPKEGEVDVTSDNNKRIAKNTLLLYFCLLFMMMVWLFTCRSCRECFRDYEIDNYERRTI